MHIRSFRVLDNLENINQNLLKNVLLDFQEEKTESLIKSNTSQDNLVYVKEIYNQKQDQIKFADTKAGISLTFNVAILGSTLGNLDKLIPLFSSIGFNIIFILFSVALIASSFYAFQVLISRFGGNTPITKIFWGHVKKEYGFDHKKYYLDICSSSLQEKISDYCSQIIELSDIASTKHRYVRNSIIATAIYLALIFPLAGIYIFEKHTEYKKDQITEIKPDANLRSVLSILEGKYQSSPQSR